jgi:hypothetical protein
VGLAGVAGYDGGVSENPYAWSPTKTPAEPPGPLPAWRRRVAILMVLLGLLCLHVIPEGLVRVVHHKEASIGATAAAFYLALGCGLIGAGMRLVRGKLFRIPSVQVWLGVILSLLISFLVSLFLPD